MRLLLSVLPNLFLGIVGFRLRAFDLSGLVAGVVLGWVITYAFGLGGFATLVGFVVLGSLTTRVSYSKKESLGISEPKGGRRTWRSAFGNLTVPALISLLYIWGGSHHLRVVLVASLATATSDTVASEIGKAYALRVLNLLKLRFDSPGTSGGVSAEGTAAGILSSLVLASVASFARVIAWNMVWVVVLSAFVGTVCESLVKSATGVKAPQVFNILNTAIGAVVSFVLITTAQ